MAMNVGTAGGDPDGDVMVDINTTPLIDVMLVLLIMFIITIPIQTHAVKMNMPTPNNAPPPKPPLVVRIDLDFDGTIGWTSPDGRTEVIPAGDRPAIESHLAQIAAQADQPEVHLRPNKLVTYKYVAMVMAEAQRLGVTKIGIVGNEQFL
ncbi:MAG: biopolymer transporter ExbD [Burkholderiales bacterium]|nr:biopolymer transporter ExbD [Burkholderiales bacterium]